MRKIILIFLLSITLFTALAQQRISLVSGVHQSAVSTAWQLQQGALSQIMQQKSGFHLGFIADIPIVEHSGWYFQPGVVYYTKGAKQKQVFDTSQTKLSFYQYSQSINYIDMPMNLVYKFASNTNTRFILGGGPFASLYYSGNVSFSSLDTLGNFALEINRDLPVGSRDQQFSSIYWGVNFLAGLEFGKAFLTVNYNKGFTSYFQQGNKHYKHLSYGITLGFFLNAPKEEDRNVRDGVYKCPAWW